VTVNCAFTGPIGARLSVTVNCTERGRPLMSTPPGGADGVIERSRATGGRLDWSARSRATSGAREASMATTGAGVASWLTEAAIAPRTPAAPVIDVVAPAGSGAARFTCASPPVT
jgi:hypothetical protein